MRRKILIALAFAGSLLGATTAATAHDPGRYGGVKLHGWGVVLPGQVTIQFGNPKYQVGHRHAPRHYRGGHYGYKGYGYGGHRHGHKGYGYGGHRRGHKGYGYGGKQRRYQVQQCFELPARGYGGHRIVCPGGYAYKPMKRVPKRHFPPPHRHYQPRYSWY